MMPNQINWLQQSEGDRSFLDFYETDMISEQYSNHCQDCLTFDRPLVSKYQLEDEFASQTTERKSIQEAQTTSSSKLLSQQIQQTSVENQQSEKQKAKSSRYVHKRKNQLIESIRIRPGKSREELAVVKVIFSLLKRYFISNNLFNAKLLDLLLRKTKITPNYACFELFFWFAEKTGSGAQSHIQQTILNCVPYLLSMSKELYHTLPYRQKMYRIYVQKICEALFCGASENERMEKIYEKSKLKNGKSILEKMKNKLTNELEKQEK